MDRIPDLTPDSGTDLPGDQGFALPAVLTMLLLVSLLAGAGHTLSTIELRRSESHRLSVEMFYRADGALQAFLGAARGAPPAGSSSSFPGGQAQVTARSLLRLPGGERLYHVVSRAETRPPGGGLVRKGVGTLVLAGEAFRPAAALLTLATLEIGPGSARLDGFDPAGPAACEPASTVAGLALLGDPPPLPPSLHVAGVPPVLALEDPAKARALSGLDWAALTGPDGPEPAATLPEEPWGGDPDAPDTAAWPVIRVEAGFRLDAAHSGRGAILALGDLELGDGFRWEGLVLVGGRLRISGPVAIRGSVASGLARLAGGDAGGTVLEGEGADLTYDSCFATAAVRALGLPPAERRGAWYEEMEAWF